MLILWGVRKGGGRWGYSLTQAVGMWLGGEVQRRTAHRGGSFPPPLQSPLSHKYFQSLLLAGHSAKGGFNSTDASNHYPSDVLQVQCVLQPVLTADRALVPDIIPDI